MTLEKAENETLLYCKLIIKVAFTTHVSVFLAHLWEAYAIPVALSVGCRTSCVVCQCVHHNYQK